MAHSDKIADAKTTRVLLFFVEGHLSFCGGWSEVVLRDSFIAGTKCSFDKALVSCWVVRKFLKWGWPAPIRKPLVKEAVSDLLLHFGFEYARSDELACLLGMRCSSGCLLSATCPCANL
eukprot:4070246-Amphidinium_carterae.1